MNRASHRPTLLLGSPKTVMRGGTDGCCDLRRERAIARVRRTCDACAPLSHLRGPSRRAVGQNYRGDRDLDSLKRFVASLAKPPTKQRIMALDMLANELYRAENNTQQQQQLLDRMRSAADNFGCVSRDRSSLVFFRRVRPSASTMAPDTRKATWR